VFLIRPFLCCSIWEFCCCDQANLSLFAYLVGVKSIGSEGLRLSLSLYLSLTDFSSLCGNFGNCGGLFLTPFSYPHRFLAGGGVGGTRFGRWIERCTKRCPGGHNSHSSRVILPRRPGVFCCTLLLLLLRPCFASSLSTIAVVAWGDS
jgi:hypothetical protein